MNFKDVIKSGTDILAGSLQQIAENEKLNQALHKAVEVASDVSAEAAKTVSKVAVETLEKTKEYVDENHLAPGAKEQYIKELEETIRKKDREIAQLKKRLAKKNWKK